MKAPSDGLRSLRLLARLVRPAKDAARYRALLRRDARLEEVHLAESRALEIGDYRTVHDLTPLRRGLKRRDDRSIRGLDLRACSEGN
jgi:hypothetical protein